jgi:hypothetical protein
MVTVMIVPVVEEGFWAVDYSQLSLIVGGLELGMTILDAN